MSTTVIYHGSSPNNHDGVNLALSELLSSLKQKSHVQFLSLFDLLENPDLLSSLGLEDTVVCAADPYAYFIHDIRHNLDLDFRIVRFVQTGLWTGYLLQEWLSDPLVRESDICLYISSYTKKLYLSRVSFLRNKGIHLVCMPQFDISQVYSTEIPKKSNRSYASAYVGRISVDKGFENALRSFELLTDHCDYRKFAVAGQIHPSDYSLSEVKQLIDCCNASIDFYGFVSHRKALDIIANSKTLLFPSTSNVESLGRVIFEAGYVRTPVIAPRHGEAPLLLSSKNLIDPNYKDNYSKCLDTHFPLGDPDPLQISQTTRKGASHVPSEVLLQRESHWNRFMRIIDNSLTLSTTNESKYPEGWLPPIASKVPSTISKMESIIIIKRIRRFVSQIVGNSNLDKSLRDTLTTNTTDKERTNRFITKYSKGKVCMSNIGDIPIQSSHLVNFKPKIVSYNQ